MEDDAVPFSLLLNSGFLVWLAAATRPEIPAGDCGGDRTSYMGLLHLLGDSACTALSLRIEENNAMLLDREDHPCM